MPVGLDDYGTQTGAFVLVKGAPASGKTTMLAGLVRAGFSLHILDLDRQLGPMITQLTPEQRATVIYEPIDLDLVLDPTTGIRVPRNGNSNPAWAKLVEAQTRWPTPGADGKRLPFYTDAYWDDAVIVIDSLNPLRDLAFIQARIYDRTKGAIAGIGDFRGMRDYWPAAQALDEYLKGWHGKLPRRFHFVLTAHTKQLNITPSKTLSPDEVERAVTNPAFKAALVAGKDPATGKTAMPVTFKSEREYTDAVTAADCALFDRLFNTVVATHVGAGDRREVYTTGHPTTITRVPYKVPQIMSLLDALPTIITAHRNMQ